MDMEIDNVSEVRKKVNKQKRIIIVLSMIIMTFGVVYLLK